VPDPIRTRDVIIEEELRSRATEVERLLNADLVSYLGPIDEDHISSLKVVLEAIKPRRSQLALNFETYGGYVESAERMANIMRHHYRKIDFLITTFALSAGTVLVMSGDRVWMDYSASLGPIDPQVQRRDSDEFVPALGYLEQYRRLIDKSREGTLTQAELHYLVENFDPAELYQYEQARDLSAALIKEWLVKYKFRRWSVTETRQLRVTRRMKEERAAEIARILSETELWHSHSRGISMKVARRDLGLLIEDLDQKTDEMREIRDALTAYNSLLFDYRMRRNHGDFVIDSAGGYFGN
jgi:hypothetical protein